VKDFAEALDVHLETVGRSVSRAASRRVEEQAIRAKIQGVDLAVAEADGDGR
jgi:hypothetical protein